MRLNCRSKSQLLHDISHPLTGQMSIELMQNIHDPKVDIFEHECRGSVERQIVFMSFVCSDHCRAFQCYVRPPQRSPVSTSLMSASEGDRTLDLIVESTDFFGQVFPSPLPLINTVRQVAHLS